MSEDHCVICADALEWTGFGPCGHKEACSRCVARLRFVLEDKRCMYCHQQQDVVYFTRYMGDYTHRPADFDTLKDRAGAGEVHKLEEVGGYFDDREHYLYIKALCSYTHPSLAKSGTAPAFNSLDQLKRRVQEQVKLHFCDLCLKGRKVFISEQVLYSQRDLDRHNRTGDDAGPLAEGGFKGHPACHFCRERFFDSNDLYNHMERSHEHCFLCRRNNPNKYVYFKDYAELDAHFQSEHHPCPHPACLERRFVVFNQEAELKRHFAAEHGEEMRMSRAQRREALTVPVHLQFAPRPRAGSGRGAREAEVEAPLPPERPGIVIGGGAGLVRAGGRGGGGGRGGMRHSRSDPAMAAAVAASVESAGTEALRRSAAEAQQGEAAVGGGPALGSVTFNAADFPAVSGGRAGPGGGVALGTWVAGTGAGPSTSGGGGAALAAEDFPELPTMSRAQKQRQRQKAKAAATTLAGRMAAAAAPPRVVHRATPAAVGASSSGSGMHASRSAGNLEASSSSIAPAPASSSRTGSDVEDGGAEDAFPALGGAGASSSTRAHPSWVPVRSKAPRPGSRGPSEASVPLRHSDFPTLGGGAARAAARASSSAAAAGGAAARAGGSGSGGGARDTAAQVAQQGGVSEQLKAANRALVERIKEQLDVAGFASFRERSSLFMRGELTADSYHDLIVSLGLLPLVAQLAELCPDASKRDSLLAAHKEFLQSSRAQDAAVLGAGWLPPEAALAAARRAEQCASWACGVCTLINAPSSKVCEVCGAPRVAVAAAGGAQGQQQQRPGGRTAAEVLAAPLQYEPAPEPFIRPGSGGSSGCGATAQSAPPPPPGGASWPSLGGGASSSTGAGSSAAGRDTAGGSGTRQAAAEQLSEPEDAPSPAGKGKGKKKPVKQSLQQLLQSGHTAPGNAWSQTQRTAQLGAVPAVARPRGAWGGKAGGGDKLARQLRATGLGEW